MAWRGVPWEAARVLEHRIRWTLRRREWLRTEWPAVVLWCGWAGALLAPLALAIQRSLWWLALLPLWWLVGGRKAAGIVSFLALGRERFELTLREDGAIFVSFNGGEPVSAWWRGFVNQGSTFLLWGADGRYRLVIPKRALTAADYAAIEERVGVDLRTLLFAQEARL